MTGRLAPLLLLVALAACDVGLARGTSDADLGGCPHGMRKVGYETRRGFTGALLRSDVVVETDRVTVADRYHSPYPEIELDDVRPVYGSHGTPGRMGADSLTGDRAAAATRAGLRLLVGATDGPDGLVVGTVAAIRPDGNVAFVGPCAFPESREVREFLASRGRPADVLRQILADPKGEQARALVAYENPRSEAWHLRPPGQRQIVDAPAEFQRGITWIALRYELPGAWRDFPVSICQRLTVALGDCVRPDIASPADVHGYLPPREDLVVQANGANAGWDVRGPLVTVPHAVAITAGTGRGRAIRLVGDPAIKDLDTLLRRGRDGPPPFTVTVVPL